MTTRLVTPSSKQDWRHARQLVDEYATSLNLDLSFQNLAYELAHITVEYGPPTGTFLMAVDKDAYVGCVGLRQFAPGVGEIKRLYVIPAARGRGIGRVLARGIVSVARQLGYAHLLLDTLPSMSEAHSLYASLGFKPTAAYRYNPVPGTAFLQLDLR